MKLIKFFLFILGVSQLASYAEAQSEPNWKNVIRRINYKMINVDWRQSSFHDIIAPLEINTAESFQKYTIGDFTLYLHNGKRPALKIYHKSNHERAVFSSSEGNSFIRAGMGKAEFEQYRGSFTIQDQKLNSQCMAQSIDSITSTSETLTISGKLSGFKCESAYTIKFKPESSLRLRFDIDITNTQLNRSFLVHDSDPKEAFFGFGEQFTHINLKGRKVPVFAQEQGHLRGLMPYTFFVNRISPGSAGAWFSTYTAVPQYITNRNRGLFLENYEFSFFDLSKPSEVSIRIFKNGMQGQILAGEDPLELVEAYTEYSGRMKPLPDWMHKGDIVGLMGGSERVRKIYDRLNTHRVPLGGLWIQDWVGKRDTGFGIRMWWNWELDESTYPDWRELVSELHDQDIKVLGYINPYLTDASGKPGVKTNFFQIAKEQNYLTTWANGQPAEIDSGGFTGTLLDISNPEARQWFKNEITIRFQDLGFSGWMADFGEALPLDARLQNAEPSYFHNQYLESWAALNQEIAQELGDDVIFFSRNASIKSPAYAHLFWAGDQMVTWDKHDGLKSSLTGILSGGFSGMSLNHSDIGGLISMKRDVLGMKIDFTRDQELLLRWAEMNVFSPVYRNHEGNNPKKNHQFYTNHKTLKGFAYFARLFALFFDYRKLLMQDAHEKGHPLMRHMIMHFPDDPKVLNFPYQFMFGPDFLVAPVTEPEVNRWDVYLPEGNWVHLFSNEAYTVGEAGKIVNVSANLGEPPVFFKAESTHGQKIQAKLNSIGPINFP
jgi:alpha-glucosidase